MATISCTRWSRSRSMGLIIFQVPGAPWRPCGTRREHALLVQPWEESSVGEGFAPAARADVVATPRLLRVRHRTEIAKRADPAAAPAFEAALSHSQPRLTLIPFRLELAFTVVDHSAPLSPLPGMTLWLTLQARKMVRARRRKRLLDGHALGQALLHSAFGDTTEALHQVARCR